jgi:Predicted transcriptional regulator with C-terminal CBS domains
LYRASRRANLVISRSSRFWNRVIARSRPEGVRWLRSDGSPNWSQRVLKTKVGGASFIASKPPVVVNKSSSILEAVELMGSRGLRGLPVVEFNKLVGIVTAMDIVNYLGGGSYFNIVTRRYDGNVFKALRDERVSTIMSASPTAVYTSDDISRVLELMIGRGLGFLPVVNHEGGVEGVITEHDVVMLLTERKIGVKASEIMTSTIVTVSVEDPLGKAAETMVKHGFRRLVVVSGDVVEGSISAKGFVELFSSGKAYTFLKSTNINDILETPVSEAVERNYITASEDSDVGEICNLMKETRLNWVLVTRGEEVVGIVTERDILVALALENTRT